METLDSALGVTYMSVIERAKDSRDSRLPGTAGLEECKAFVQ